MVFCAQHSLILVRWIIQSITINSGALLSDRRDQYDVAALVLTLPATADHRTETSVFVPTTTGATKLISFRTDLDLLILILLINVELAGLQV